MDKNKTELSAYSSCIPYHIENVKENKNKKDELANKARSSNDLYDHFKTRTKQIKNKCIKSKYHMKGSL